MYYLSLPFPPLEVGLLNPARGTESAVSSPSRVWVEPKKKSILVHFSLKMHLVRAIVTLVCKILGVLEQNLGTLEPP